MKLLTAAIKKKLLANGRKPDAAHFPVVKLFGGGACTWLLSELDEDEDTAFGLCDLGMGCPELGSVSISELEALKFPPFGLPPERDMYTTFDQPLVDYAHDARQSGRITI